jgi:hypothetical protein
VSDRNTKKPTPYSYEKGEMITFTYGNRSNAFLLLFYGFCVPGNKYDSVTIQVNRVLKTAEKQNLTKMIPAFVLSDIALKRRQEFKESNSGSKIAAYLDSQVSNIKLKASRLNDDLLMHLRANCLLAFKGEDTSIEKV